MKMNSKTKKHLLKMYMHAYFLENITLILSLHVRLLKYHIDGLDFIVIWKKTYEDIRKKS